MGTLIQACNQASADAERNFVKPAQDQLPLAVIIRSPSIAVRYRLANGAVGGVLQLLYGRILYLLL